jgi:hypothetical protein
LLLRALLLRPATDATSPRELEAHLADAEKLIVPLDDFSPRRPMDFSRAESSADGTPSSTRIVSVGCSLVHWRCSMMQKCEKESVRCASSSVPAHRAASLPTSSASASASGSFSPSRSCTAGRASSTRSRSVPLPSMWSPRAWLYTRRAWSARRSAARSSASRPGVTLEAKPST